MTLNPQRGDAQIEIAGRVCRLRLTLGALAGIEHALGVDDVSTLAARLARPSSDELRAVLGALLEGGGEDAALADKAKPGAAARAVAEAVERAFS